MLILFEAQWPAESEYGSSGGAKVETLSSGSLSYLTFGTSSVSHVLPALELKRALGERHHQPKGGNHVDPERP